MSYKIRLIILRLLLFFSLLIYGCKNSKKRIFISPPIKSTFQVQKVCSELNSSHFYVKNNRIWINGKGNKKFELKNFKSLLDDGYYFCTEKN